MMKETWIFKDKTLFIQFHDGYGWEENEFELSPISKENIDGSDVWVFPSPAIVNIPPIIGEENDRIIIKYEKCPPPKTVEIEIDEYDEEMTW